MKTIRSRTETIHLLERELADAADEMRGTEAAHYGSYRSITEILCLILIYIAICSDKNQPPEVTTPSVTVTVTTAVVYGSFRVSVDTGYGTNRYIAAIHVTPIMARFPAQKVEDEDGDEEEEDETR